MPGSDFGWIIDAHHEKIYRAACMLLMNRHEAEDLTQDVFLAAMKSYSRFRGDSSLYTWLYKIMLNLFRKKKARRRLLQWNVSQRSDAEDFQVLFTDDGDTPEETVEKGERARKVSLALKSLSAKHREVVLLRFYEDKSYHEIADILGCSEGTVKSRLHHALRQTGGRLQDLKPARRPAP
ncbi:MAG TPA: sigma-70 family RNA polymerase sigma factor [Planctomycetota bacterium]|nr:sigma-70 family RNA polymerase sigma factor [Planctomycetota bacterium]